RALRTDSAPTIAAPILDRTLERALPMNAAIPRHVGRDALSDLFVAKHRAHQEAPGVDRMRHDQTLAVHRRVLCGADLHVGTDRDDGWLNLKAARRRQQQ